MFYVFGNSVARYLRTGHFLNDQGKFLVYAFQDVPQLLLPFLALVCYSYSCRTFSSFSSLFFWVFRSIYWGEFKILVWDVFKCYLGIILHPISLFPSEAYSLAHSSTQRSPCYDYPALNSNNSYSWRFVVCYTQQLGDHSKISFHFGDDYFRNENAFLHNYKQVHKDYIISCCCFIVFIFLFLYILIQNIWNSIATYIWYKSTCESKRFSRHAD